MPKFTTGYKKFMDDSEIKLLIQYVHQQSEQIILIFYILIMIGIRVGEACALRREYIHGNKMVIPLEKSNRIHERIIPDYLKELIYGYIANHNITEGWLFPTDHNKFYNGRHEHIMPQTISWYMHKFRIKYNLDEVYYTVPNGGALKKPKKLYRISAHTIRHHFLTKLYDECGDLLLVAEIIGHKKITTTIGYLTAYKKLQRERVLVNRMVFI